MVMDPKGKLEKRKRLAAKIRPPVDAQSPMDMDDEDDLPAIEEEMPGTSPGAQRANEFEALYGPDLARKKAKKREDDLAAQEQFALEQAAGSSIKKPIRSRMDK